MSPGGGAVGGSLVVQVASRGRLVVGEPYFEPAGPPLDQGAGEGGSSVYVPGRVAPMLPHELADDACSLRPHQDRLTLTVEVPFGDGLEAGEPTFYRSVIRSRARLTYAQ